MSGFVSERVLEEIRFRNDIVEVIQGYLPLKRAGATYKACCPFHKEKTPSFNVNPNMQIFKCFGCGEGGDVIGFVMKHQGLDFMAAVRMLADRAGVTIESDGNSSEAEHRKRLFAIHEGLARFYRRCLLEYAGGEKARDYVCSRRLDDQAGELFGVGYAPSGWTRALRWGEKHGYREEDMVEAGVALLHREKNTCYDRFRDRLMFPIRDVQGRVVGFSGRLLEKDSKEAKYVNSPETALFSKGRILYGLDLARQAILASEGREAIVAEGQVDVIRCHQYGFTTAVAGQGTAFTDEQVALLKRYADSAVLVYDSDGAGQAAALKTAHALMRAGIVVRVALLPAGDDPDSYLLREGPEAFAVLLEGAVTTVAFQIGAMRAGAKDAEGISMTTRAAKAVLETITCTPDAVQRSFLLNEAAAMLSVSQSALEADLRKLEQLQRETRERQIRRTPDAVAKDEPPAGDVPSRAAAKGSAALPAAERTFLQGVVHGGRDVWRSMASYLAPALFLHPACRALFVAFQWSDSQGKDVDAVAVPAGREVAYEQAMRLLERLRREVPLSAGDEQVMALQHVVLRIWKQYLDAELRALKRHPGYPDDEGIFGRCSQIAHDLDSLRHWDSGQDVIETELAMMDGTAAESC
jgi:DNA primase